MVCEKGCRSIGDFILHNFLLFTLSPTGRNLSPLTSYGLGHSLSDVQRDFAWGVPSGMKRERERKVNGFVTGDAKY